jgi:hypothetical protein
MRSTEVTKSCPSAPCAAVAKALLTGLLTVVAPALGHPGIGADGSLDEACCLKQLVNFEMAAAA